MSQSMLRVGLQVSVSFRSSILFYPKENTNMFLFVKSFRLLSEFNSLLYELIREKCCVVSRFPSPFGVQFFLMENMGRYEIKLLLFPSPFGVQFFLILPQQTPYFIIYYFIIFVRILKIFIFLFFNNKKYTLTPTFKVSWRLLKKIIIFVFNFI